MKKKVSLAIVFIAAIVIILQFLKYESNIIVHTTGPYGLIGNAPTNVYLTGNILKIKFSTNNYQSIVSNMEEINEEENLKNIEIVKKIDSNVFDGKYTSSEDKIFRIDNDIYYYRNNVYDKFFKYNIETNQIQELDFSGFVKDNISDYNAYVHLVNIETEALINTYPLLEEQINAIDGMFYGRMFYDNGRIFFEKRNVIYEYVVNKNKVRKICIVATNKTIQNIFIKNINDN